MGAMPHAETVLESLTLIALRLRRRLLQLASLHVASATMHASTTVRQGAHGFNYLCVN